MRVILAISIYDQQTITKTIQQQRRHRYFLFIFERFFPLLIIISKMKEGLSWFSDELCHEMHGRYHINLQNERIMIVIFHL